MTVSLQERIASLDSRVTCLTRRMERLNASNVRTFKTEVDRLNAEQLQLAFQVISDTEMRASVDQITRRVLKLVGRLYAPLPPDPLEMCADAFFTGVCMGLVRVVHQTTASFFTSRRAVVVQEPQKESSSSRPERTEEEICAEYEKAYDDLTRATEENHLHLNSIKSVAKGAIRFAVKAYTSARSAAIKTRRAVQDKIDWANRKVVRPAADWMNRPFGELRPERHKAEQQRQSEQQRLNEWKTKYPFSVYSQEEYQTQLDKVIILRKEVEERGIPHIMNVARDGTGTFFKDPISFRGLVEDIGDANQHSQWSENVYLIEETKLWQMRDDNYKASIQRCLREQASTYPTHSLGNEPSAELHTETTERIIQGDIDASGGSSGGQISGRLGFHF